MKQGAGRRNKWLAAALAVCFAQVCSAQQTSEQSQTNAKEPPPAEGSDASELAKKTQSPVSDLISVPFENLFGFEAGADGEFSYTLLIKPVYPQPINEDWNWIHRAIIPVFDQPSLGPNGLGEECGLGDIQYQGFLSPANDSEWI
jgi:hypothetical protein